MRELQRRVPPSQLPKRRSGLHRGFARRRLLLATGFILLPMCAQPDGPQETPAHLILISLDTTRADHFGFLGSSPSRTPHLDALAAESIVFTDYLTVAPSTLASHASLFTGRYPHHHGVPRNGFVMSDTNETLAEMLRGSGFRTDGFAAAFALAQRFRIAQGFDFYDQSFGCADSDQACGNERSAQEVTDAVLRRLDAEGVPERLFLFVHYFDPHRPYEAPAPFDVAYDPRGRAGLVPIARLRRSQNAPESWGREGRRHELQYASEISYMDQQIDRLLAGLRERGVLEHAVLVVTSDHGETLLEHAASFSHGMLVNQGSVRAVCLVRLPDGRRAGSRIDGPVASIDVLPTVLPLLGLPVPPGIDGESIPITQDEIPARGPRFGQATQPPRVEGDHAWPNAEKARFVRDGRFKLIQTPFLGIEELYDLEADPAERRNLLEDAGPEEAALAQRLRALLEIWAASADPLAVQRSALDLEAIERLKALGYLEN